MKKTLERLHVLRHFDDKYQVFLIFILFLFLYSVTIYPEVGGRINYGDSAKWQYIFLTNYVPHPTGYPVYIWLSILFDKALFFIEPVAYRITAISVFFGALTVALFFKFILDISRNIHTSYMLTFVFGTLFTFWTQATEAEVYTLNSFLVLSVVYSSYKFFVTGNVKYIYLSIILLALSVGNHMTSAVFAILPGILVLLMKPSLIFKVRFIAFVLFSVLIVIAEYIYVYNRFLYTLNTFSINFFYDSYDLTSFYDYLSGSKFKEKMWDSDKFVSSVMNFPLDTFPYEVFFSYSKTDNIYILFFLFLFFLFIIGISIYNIFSNKGSRKFLILLSFPFGIYTIYSFSYLIGDYTVYFIPIYMIILLLISFTESTIILRFTVTVLFILSLLSFPAKFDNLKNTDNTILRELRTVLDGIDNADILSPTNAYLMNTYPFQMLENYLSFTGDYGKYNFVSLYDTSAQKYDKLYLTRSLIDRSKPVDLYPILKGRILKPVKLYKSAEEVITENGYDFVLVVGGVEFFSILHSEPNIKEILSSLGSKYIDDICYGNSYVALIHNSRIVKEFAGKGTDIKGNINTGDFEINFHITSSDCKDINTTIGSTLPSVSIKGRSDFILSTALNIFVIDRKGNITEFYKFSKSPFDERELFVVQKIKD